MLGGPFEHGVGQVAVHIRGRGEAGVAEDPRHDGQFLALFEAQCGRAMSQIMEPLTGESGCSQDRLEVVPDVVRVEGPPCG